MKISLQEQRNALLPLALDPNSTVGKCRPFFFPSHAKLAAHFPHSRAASHCSTVIIAAAAEATFSAKQREGSSFAVWIGVELSLCLSRCQPDSPPPFLAPFCR